MTKEPQVQDSDAGSKITFADLLNQRQWEDYNAFITDAPAVYIAELEKDLRQEARLKDKLRTEVLNKKFSVRTYDPLLPKAQDLLFSGQVIGIDGTVSRVRTLSGLRCQIGIVAVNYFNEKIRQSYFISEATLQEDIEDVIEVLKRRESKGRIISDMVVRALMLYREREVALREQFKSCYKMLHGPLLPFELMTGLGRLRALEATLDVLERIIADKRCFSIVSSSTQDDYLTLGTALQPGEYFVDETFTCGEEITTNEDFMAEKKWRSSELERMKKFLSEYGSKVCVGVIKVSQRPYVFQAHRDHFDLAAALIARDSLLQKEKGFPLLIDYADTLCSGYFPPADFSNLLAYKLAQSGNFLAEMPEQSMRLK
jgi:hypothetical protein